MKLYKGKKRLAKYFLPPWKQRILKWALSLKVGDTIGTCEGRNRTIKEIQIEWANEGKWRRGRPNKTWALADVIFTDENGRWHHCPGGGCVSEPYTEKELKEMWPNEF